MKPSERDNLLIRLDEKAANIYHLTEKQEKHLASLNEKVSTHSVDIGKNKTSIKWIIRILIACGILSGTGIGIERLLNGG